MEAKLYTSLDAGAPQTTTSAGSVLAILEACLVTGYGAKTSLGWTKQFSGTNKAVFRPQTGNRFYLRVDDTVAARGAIIVGYKTMTSVDVGTGLFPMVSSTGYDALNPGYFLNSVSTRYAGMYWELIGTTSGFVFYFYDASTFSGTASGTSNKGCIGLFGDFVPMMAGDATSTVVGGNLTNSSSATGVYHIASLSSSSRFKNFSAAGSLGNPNSPIYLRAVSDAALAASGGSGASGSGAAGTASIAFPNGPGGGLFFSPIYLIDDSFTPAATIRGRLYGIHASYHNNASFTHGDTFTGTGDYAGRQFRVWKVYNGVVFVETTNWS